MLKSAFVHAFYKSVASVLILILILFVFIFFSQMGHGLISSSILLGSDDLNLEYELFIRSVFELALPIFIYGLIFFERWAAGRSIVVTMIYGLVTVIPIWVMMASLVEYTSFACSGMGCIATLGMGVYALVGIHAVIPIVSMTAKYFSRSDSASPVVGANTEAPLVFSSVPILITLAILVVFLDIIIIRSQIEHWQDETDANSSRMQTRTPVNYDPQNITRYSIELMDNSSGTSVSFIILAPEDCLVVVKDMHGTVLGSSPVAAGLDGYFTVNLARRLESGESATVQLFYDKNRNNAYDQSDAEIPYSENGGQETSIEFTGGG
jgi:hypothetical protein